MQDNDKLDLDKIKMKDLSEYLSLTNYLKDYTREEIETFYLKKRKVLDNEQHVKDCEKANKWNNDFENLLRYFYDLGFGPGTVVKRASMNIFSMGNDKDLFTERNAILTGKVYKRYTSNGYEVMFECYDKMMGEKTTSLMTYDKSLTFVKEYDCKRSTKTFEEVLSSLDDKKYLYL